MPSAVVASPVAPVGAGGVAGEALEVALARWDFQPSQLQEHPRRCCRDARSWFALMDRSAARDRAAPVTPSWMNHRWAWGPGRWPLHWCEAVRLEDLDCGALAAFAHESLALRGIPHGTVQIVQHYDEEACAHWSRWWQDGAGNTRWIAAPFVYHEAVALVHPAAGEWRMWDPSRGRWMDDPDGPAYGATVAVRLWPAEGLAPELRVAGVPVPPYVWTPIPVR
jgi:hypothetical protein